MNSSRRTRIADDYEDEEMLFLSEDDMDDAIVGVAWRNALPIVVYSIQEIVNTLMRNGPMSEDDAYEYFEFNIAGAYVGERTPIYVEIFK